ncbi:MAG: hypothetical protein OEY22_09260 [Candidatus Bathyarchaeota archaeon]|nr:hypothetical protein [Candidatus Bathyarchaeota archaeon]
MTHKCVNKDEYMCAEHREKTEAKTVKTNLRTRFLQLLGVNKDSEYSLNVQVSHANTSINNIYNYGQEIDTAMLEAERKKAEATTAAELNRRRLF